MLLACAPDEQHALPLHALAAGLAERGLATRVLGAAMPGPRSRPPSAAPARPCCSCGPSCRAAPTSAVLEALPVTRPATAVVVGGPGWAPETLPRRVTFAEDFSHALELVDQALGA